MMVKKEAAAKNKVKEPLFHIVKRDQLSPQKTWLVRGLAVLGGFIFICLISFFATKKSPFDVIKFMFEGTFGTERNIYVLFRETAILLLIALAITPAFKMKFWNIGAEGQVLISAFACTACMFYLGGKVNDTALIFISLAFSLLAGAIWAVIPAIFKAIWNTNETLFTLMMNYIALQIVLYYIKVWVPTGSGILSPIPYGNLPQLGGGDYWISIIVAAGFTAIMYLYLRFSKHGYEIAVVGESEKTAKYIGINVKKVIIRTLIFSGVICGVTGFLLTAGINHMISSSTVDGRGFTAVLISWLAQFNPIIMIFVAFLVAFLSRGTGKVMESSGVTNDFFSDVAIGIIYLIIIACEFFISYRVIFRKKTKIAAAEDAVAVTEQAAEITEITGGDATETEEEK